MPCFLSSRDQAARTDTWRGGEGAQGEARGCEQTGSLNKSRARVSGGARPREARHHLYLLPHLTSLRQLHAEPHTLCLTP